MTLALTSEGAPRRVRTVLEVQAVLCVLAMLFASGDIWPSVTLGFNFRFSQICLLAAAALCPVLMWQAGVRLFPGWHWLYLFIVWLFATLPLSQFITRSIGYTFWAITDVLIVFVFVQTFRTEAALVRLVRWFLISFILLGLFGIAQFALGLFGVGVLVTQWWIPGVLPRVNGISYEPSYYASYLLSGWVLSCYLLERNALIPSRRLLRVCVGVTSLALMLATSRLGWGLMVLWAVFRLGRWGLRMLMGWPMRQRTAALLVAMPLVLILAVGTLGPAISNIARVASNVSFLISGLGVLGAPGHSAYIRAGDVRATWNAFLEHPITGTGIGAVPAEIAAQRGVALRTLEDAKPHEGLSIFVEALAATGVVGLLLLLAFAVSTIRACQHALPLLAPWRAELLRGVIWSLVWVLLALQFSQNILRVWLFIDIAVLMCCLTASPRAHALDARRRAAPSPTAQAAPADHDSYTPRNPMQRPVNTSR